ncbi:MAG: glycosyl transferase [Solirubrobacterales bacterium]|nr:glycosyl transferase [Solirubrobacterales bacterium]HMT04880.1 glycosyltransferase [Solirubrobacterales bacterium]
MFPAVSLARALKGRGNEVIVETWPQWRQEVEAAGLDFVSADQYQVFPPPASGSPGAGEAAVALMPLLDEFRPDVVVNDILTVAPALAAEAFGCSWGTLIPHIYPVQDSGRPFFAVGALPARTGLGRGFWRATEKALKWGLERGRDDLNAQRALIGLPATDRFHGGTSPDLAMVTTYPHLEYPRLWPPSVHVTGPMPFETPHDDIELPPGDEPLILVAPSTSQDPSNHLVRSALAALADQPVRVVATTNRVVPSHPIEVPENAVLVDWLSYSQVMPESALIICHGGHGTVARALAEGVPVLTCPAAGDMNETAARITWAEVGRSVRWSLTGPRSLRWAVAEILGDPIYRVRAGQIASWHRRHDGPAKGAELVEELIARDRGRT